MFDLVRVLATLVAELTAAHLLLVVKLFILDVLKTRKFVLDIFRLRDQANLGSLNVMIVVQEVGVLLSKGLVFIGFTLDEGVQLIALFFEGFELSSMDFLDGFKLIAVFLFLICYLHILITF